RGHRNLRSTPPERAVPSGSKPAVWGLWQRTTGAFRLPTPCSGFRGRNILPLLEVLPRPYASKVVAIQHPSLKRTKPQLPDSPILFSAMTWTEKQGEVIIPKPSHPASGARSQWLFFLVADGDG